MNPALLASTASGLYLSPDDNINISFNHSTTTTNTTNLLNAASNLTRSPQPHLRDEIMAEYYTVAYEINRFLPIVCYLIGFIGNTISAVAWFQPRLSKRNSSAVYLALLSISDLVFLVLHCAAHVDGLLVTRLAKYRWVCEIYNLFSIVPQYLAPLLVLGFSAERYVAVCHPLLRMVLCRTRVAVSVGVAMAVSSVLLASIQPFFWTYSPETLYCAVRKSIPESLWFVWTTVVETVMFMIVPAVTLVLDVLVICCLRQVNKNPLRSIRGSVVPPSGGSQNGVGANGEGGERGDIRGRIWGKRVGKVGVALVEPVDDKSGSRKVGKVGRKGRGGGGGTDTGKEGAGGERGGGEGGGETEGGNGCGFVAANGELKRGRDSESGFGGRGEAERPRFSGIRLPYQATTAMLLTISLFEILTKVLVSIIYILHDHFPPGSFDMSKEEMLTDPTWQRYFSYRATKQIVLALCLTRYAVLIFFYLALGARFRETVWDLVNCRKRPSRFRVDRTHSTVGGSSLSSLRSQRQVALVMKP